VSLSYFVVFDLELLSLNVFNVVYISELKKKSTYTNPNQKRYHPIPLPVIYKSKSLLYPHPFWSLSSKKRQVL